MNRLLTKFEMNNTRRNEIRRIIRSLSAVVSGDEISSEQARQVLDYRHDIEDVLDEEQDAFDNMPEGLQSSYRGEISEESIDYLSEAIDGLDDIDDLLAQADYDGEKVKIALEDVIESLENVDGI